MPKQQSRVIILFQLLNSTFGLVKLNPLAATLAPGGSRVLAAIDGQGILNLFVSWGNSGFAL